jgi:hypothetical protein
VPIGCSRYNFILNVPKLAANVTLPTKTICYFPSLPPELFCKCILCSPMLFTGEVCGVEWDGNVVTNTWYGITGKYMSLIEVQSLYWPRKTWGNPRKISGKFTDLPRFEPGSFLIQLDVPPIAHWGLWEEMKLNTWFCKVLTTTSPVFINNYSHKIPLNIRYIIYLKQQLT